MKCLTFKLAITLIALFIKNDCNDLFYTVEKTSMGYNMENFNRITAKYVKTKAICMIDCNNYGTYCMSFMYCKSSSYCGLYNRVPGSVDIYSNSDCNYYYRYCKY